ncbi:bromodomain-domain-containing protein [Phanerochaete sordida]|uniref:Bromodomain-domain-containing protein n=1 Tax=Phanerochaete sordida TaxID=48140 RepID=A0A9P3L7A4_9APHY|nr:bromodomain-domain-containing protein [Phanerochaete sordida]
MATGKTSKRVRETALDTENWNTVERLILSQAIYEFGADNMPQVATLLGSHTMISRPHHFFTAETCSTVFEKLMEDANIARPDTAHARAPEVKQLATIYYQKRTQELKDAIEEEESKFKQLVKEIDDIRAGRWDDRIRQSAEAEPVPIVEALTREETAMEEDVQTSNTPPQPSEVAVSEARAVSAEGSKPPSPQPEVLEQDAATIPEELETQEDVLPEVATEPPPSDAVDVEAEGVPPAEEVEGPEVEIVEEIIRSPEAPEEQENIESAETLPDNEEEPSPEQEESIVVQEEPPIPEDVDMADSPEAEISLREAMGKRKASEAPSEVRDRKRQREDSEAIDEDEAGPSVTKGRRKNQVVADKKFQNVINMLHSSISQHRFGNIFHNPIKKQDAADYHDIVKRPMDLKTIKARVKDGTISNALEFQRDIYLMFANAMVYNRPGSEIHAMAEEMMLESEAQINQFRRTQVQIEQLRNTDGYPRI